ncbi:MAG: SMP-30/gluconolactonase/LRE family protein [Planctomycetota bacterium]|nr:SMP-30/gluconolactonase/LRE family protein [Planctomycetota bacterium]
MRIAAAFLVLAALAARAEPPRHAVTKLHTGFRFVEGPAVDKDGNLYFTDIPNERIMKRTKDGTLSVLREKSGRANGLFVHGKGKELYACEGGNGVVSALALDGKSRRVVAEKYDGKRFNAPNDLVIDKAGGVYFTDPKFGRNRADLPQGMLAVYYADATGKVARVAAQLPLPNGVILSPDEKTLYIVTSGSDRVWAYPVEKPGQLGTRKLFFRIKQPRGKTDTGGDGLTVDKNGMLYITTRRGLQVVDKTGQLVDIIEIPETPANVTFGGTAWKTLYVTARTSLYAVEVETAGHRFPAGK